MQSACAALGDSPKKREKTVRLESGSKIFRDKLNSNSAAFDKSSEDKKEALSPAEIKKETVSEKKVV